MTASDKRTLLSVLIFTALAILPSLRDPGIWTVIPIYAGAILLLWAAQDSAASKLWFILGGLDTLGLLAIYIHYLTPRQSNLPLGTAALSVGSAPKILFCLSALFALVTLVIALIQAFRCTKASK